MPASWSAMIVVAPASPSASTQPRPMPRPPPVTSATRPVTLNFSRYIEQRSALRVEPVGTGRVGSEPHVVARFQAELANGPGGNSVGLRHVDVEEGVAAEVLRGGDRTTPTIAVTAHHDMLGPNADRGRAVLGRALARHEVHPR